MRQSWTDDRLDDLNGKVDVLRVETRTEFKALRGEMQDGFAKMDGRFAELVKRFDKMDERFESAHHRTEMRFDKVYERFDQMYRVLIGFCGLMFATVVSLMAAQM